MKFAVALVLFLTPVPAWPAGPGISPAGSGRLPHQTGTAAPPPGPAIGGHTSRPGSASLPASPVMAAAGEISGTSAPFTIFISGDVNGDNELTASDLVMLEQYLTGNAPSPGFPPAADCDDNGIIEALDLLRLFMELV